MPPRKPDQVFEALISGAITRAGTSLPQTYCITSLSWAMRTKKKSNLARSAGSSIVRTGSSRRISWVKS